MASGATVFAVGVGLANRRTGSNMAETSNFWMTQDTANRIIRAQEREELTTNHHALALRLIDMGLLGTDGWRYMSVEEARECWRVCHRK